MRKLMVNISVPQKKANDASPKPPSTNSFNIGEEIMVCVRILQVFGMAPLRYRRESSGRWCVTASLALRLYSWMFILAVALTSTYAFYVQSTLPETKSMATRLVTLLQFIAMNSCLLATAFTVPIRTRMFLEYTETMSQLHDRFSKNEFKRSNFKMLTILFASIAGFFIVLMQETADNILDNSSINAKIILCYLPSPVEYILCLMLEGKFTLLVWMLESRADAVIRRVDEFLVEGERQSWRDVSQVLQRVQRLHELQAALRRCASALNAAFGLPMLIAVVFIMIEIIIAIYYMIVDLDHFSIRTFLLNLQWILILVWWLMVVIEPCHQYVEKDQMISNRISTVILKLSESKIFNCDWRDENKIKIFKAQQILFSSTEINITALDICIMRRSLLGSIAGAVTTYLVILLQLKDTKI